MTTRNLDKAAEFCLDVEADHLFGYLKIDEDSSSEDLVEAIKARRKWAQAQQNNPKYKREAKKFISAYEALIQVASDPQQHLEHQQKRREDKNLPSLQMAIDAILSGGANPSLEQLSFLEGKADELNIARETLYQILKESGRSISNPPSPQRSHSGDSGSIDHEATTADRPPLITSSSIIQRPPSPMASTGRSRTPSLGTPVGPPATPGPSTRSTSTASGPPRRHSADATAPPVRRVNAPNTFSNQPTQPPVVDAPTSGRSKGLIEPAGQHHFEEIIHGRPRTLTGLKVRFMGALPLDAQISSDVEWITVEPSAIKPLDTQPEVTPSGKKVRIIPFSATLNPSQMPDKQATGRVTVFNSAGDHATFRFDVTRTFNWIGLLKGGLIALVTVVLLAGFAFLVNEILTPRHGKILVIRLDPSAEVVMLDNQVIGSGSIVRHSSPLAGDRKLTVVQPNFQTVEKMIRIRPQEEEEVVVELNLSSKLDYTPGPDEKRANIAPAATKQAESAIAPCLTDLEAPLRGEVHLNVLKNGTVGSIRFKGDFPEIVSTCATRRLAALRFDSLPTGDYAQLIAKVQHP